MGGQPLESMLERIRDYLASGERSKIQAAYLANLREQAGVKILLEPPRANIEVQADEPARGPAEAPIVIVEYSDFECPYCERAQPSIQQVLDTYGDKVRLVYRDFPLRIHDNARLAAQATHCAGEQDAYWPMHLMLFDNYKQLNEESLRGYAAQLQLDGEAFSTCLASDRHLQSISSDMQEAKSAGISGTPSFVLGASNGDTVQGNVIRGAQSFDNFKRQIEALLAEQAKG